MASLADDGQGGRVPFATFNRRLQRVYYGFVFTAHPTFGRTMELQRMLAATAFEAPATAPAPGGPAGAGQPGSVEATAHRPPANLDLAEEHAQSLMVIRQARAMVRRIHEVAFDLARELYPDEWRELRPRLVTLATWVGYDTDGRADIAWSTTFAKRLAVQLEQLRHYQARVQTCLEHAEGEPLLAPLLELLDARLALAIKSAQDDLAVLDDQRGQGAEWRARLARVAKGMVAERAVRLTDAAQVLGLVDRALAAAQHDATVLRLCLLRAELATRGLTAAATHVRINAIQLHNAIRKTIGMDHAPDDPTHRLTYVNAISRLIETVEPETINFGSVAEEKATARRVFMTMAQMLKHLDGSEPIRFLIAEYETPSRSSPRSTSPSCSGSTTGSTSRRCSRPGRPWSAAPRSSKAPWRSRPTATTCAAAAASASRPASPTPGATWARPQRRWRSRRSASAWPGRWPTTAWPTSSSPSSTRTARASAGAPTRAASPTGCATTTRRRAAAGSPPPASSSARRAASRAATATSPSSRPRARSPW